MIDHDEVRELLELAAVQPGGLDRLAAGDTAESAALAGHLAGCPSCSAEADRLRASAGLIRTVVQETPPPELRERTLALVRAVGRPRVAAELSPAAASAGAGIAPVPAAAPLIPPVAVDRGVAEPARSQPIQLMRRRSIRTILLPLGMAAALVIAIAGTAAVVGGRQDPALIASQQTSAELAKVTSWTLRVAAEPDVQRIALAGQASSGQGTLLFSPTTTDLVVVASGLAQAPAGQEYRCWVLVNGTRQDIGRMDQGGGLAYWVGPVPGLLKLPPGTPFGVSLATVNGPLTPGDPVIGGSVGS